MCLLMTETETQMGRKMNKHTHHRRRDILHRKDADNFRIFLEEQGYKTDPPRDIWQVFCVLMTTPWSPSQPIWVGVYAKNKPTEHLTLSTPELVKLAHLFIREKKQKKGEVMA